MSFAICRMEKLKSHDLKGLEFHHEREKESKTNPDIDKTKIHLNYDFVNKMKIDYNKRVKEIIESQKTGKRKTRKDAVLVNELLVTSDRAFFDNLDSNEKKRFFEESYKLFSERYGEQNIAYAIVHNDEKTPHMHLGVVPMRDGKLQGKNVFNRVELQWIQDEFPKHLQKQGFDLERGEKGSNREHLTTQKYKVKTLKEKVKVLESRLIDFGKSLDRVKKIDDVEIKMEKKMGLFASDRVILGRKDFKGIKTLAKASETLRMENKHLKMDNEQLQEGKHNLVKENKLLRIEKNDLKKENNELKKENFFLKKTLEQVKVLYKEKIPELAKMIGYAKASILDKTKEKLLKQHFVDDFEIKGAQKFAIDKQEKAKDQQKITRNKERDLGMER